MIFRWTCQFPPSDTMRYKLIWTSHCVIVNRSLCNVQIRQTPTHKSQTCHEVYCFDNEPVKYLCKEESVFTLFNIQSEIYELFLYAYEVWCRSTVVMRFAHFMSHEGVSLRINHQASRDVPYKTSFHFNGCASSSKIDAALSQNVIFVNSPRFPPFRPTLRDMKTILAFTITFDYIDELCWWW